jgi:1-pyrroline dehydrogenase
MNEAAANLSNFIGGDWADSVGADVDEVLNPSTGGRIAVAPRGSADDIGRAVKAAEAALPAWLDTTPGYRSSLLFRLAAVIEEHADELIRLEAEDTGKPAAVGAPELPGVVNSLRFYAGAARNLDGVPAGEYLAGHTSMFRREPIGVVGIIVPWNYPLATAAGKIGSALAAGNACVVKPSELTPLSLLRFAELSRDILPPGVLNVVLGDGEITGVALVEHPGVGMVSLTGDVSTGKEVARAAARSLKRVHLELGGKAPVVVFADADLADVVETIKVAGYWNAGQECAAACRVLADATVYDELLARLADAVTTIRVGSPDEGPHVDMGPVISPEQRQRIVGFLDRAVDGGARVVAGGSVPDRAGFFVDPTVVTEVGQGDDIVQGEVFGPVVTVQGFETDDQGVRWANDVPYGLCASIWTRDLARGLGVARQLQFGTVWINDHLPTVSEMPWTGRKQSGYGHAGSRYALDDYTQVKHVMAKIK